MARRASDLWTLDSVIVLALVLLGSSCKTSDNTVCPGHIEGNAPEPELAIRTSDGSQTIASLELDSRVCQGFHSSQPDAGVRPSGGYSELKLRMARGLFPESAMPVGSEPPPCVVEVVSIYGASVKIAATVYYDHRAARHCYMNDDCCDPTRIEWLCGARFSPQVQTVTFPPGPDASSDTSMFDAILDATSSRDAVID